MKQKFKKTIDNIPVKLSDLTLHPENPRKRYVDSDILALAGSLEKNGQINLIVIDEYGYILSGNRRYLAAQTLGWEYLKADIKVGLDDFTKRAILITTNITQKNINAWENRDIIAKTYWGSFLKNYAPISNMDKGYTNFAKTIGISKPHVKKIIEASAEENKEWVQMLRKNNLPSALIDTIIGFPESRRKIITINLIERKELKPNLTRDDLRSIARQFNREMKLDKMEKFPGHMFGRILRNVGHFSKYLIIDHIEKLSDEQRERMKEKMQTVIDYYNKL